MSAVVHGQAPNAEKGARYLGLLDQALCNGSWSDVPELARKVDKHAPERKCLTLAARAECQVAAASHRPTSASSGTVTSIHGLGELVPRLAELIAATRSSRPEDAYVASTCLAEIHWLREAPLDAINTLHEATAPIASGSGPASPLGWLEVCAVKTSFIKASCLDSSGRQSEARETFRAAVKQTPGSRTPELRKWTERLLARACMYGVKKIPSPSLQDMGETYAAFKAWGDFWQRAPAQTGDPAPANPLDISRRQVWREYYDLLSTVLQHALLLVSQSNDAVLVLPVDEVPELQRVTTRQRQRVEIQRVEATYETLLLAETKFPKASESNAEVEEWVEQVMANWTIFSGPAITDSDVGRGGKGSVSRGVLNILYRAATKTFHSTPILRHLFTVHTALGEFDLAMHAFNSYVEIVDKGKTRAEKTGKHEMGLDDDDTAMLTAAQAVRVLCRYGDRDQAEKAMTITKLIERWLQQRRPATAGSAQTNGVGSGDGSTSTVLKPHTLGAAYRAIGVSQARWAQLTYESETRSTLLADARNSLERAQTFRADDVETSHALALVLAEMRDVSGSMDLIRATLEPKQSPVGVNGHDPLLAVDRQRQLIPLWHLLSLCLTAEDQLEAAAHICEAAYGQFGDARVLFGSGPMADDPEKQLDDLPRTRGVVDQMESFEKESMMQIKMTQIMLFEFMEGAEEASDLTDELSGLYSRLFGNPEQVVAELTVQPPSNIASHAPTRLGGTLRSIAGSIRPKSSKSTRSNDKDTLRQRSTVSEESNATAQAPSISNRWLEEIPIAITVTNEDGVPSEKPSHRQHLPHLPFHGRTHGSNSARSKSPRRAVPEAREHSATIDKPITSLSTAAVSNGIQPEQTLGDVEHSASHDDSLQPASQNGQLPRQDLRLPTPHLALSNVNPEPQMSPLHERRHKISVLLKAWLFSAGLYIRAEIYDDAENLINDAAKLTQSLELELSQSEDGTNARRLFHRGWGSGKSVDELWADVWSAKAQLASSREHPYEAMAAYEHALLHDPDHPAGIIGLSNLLMDIYEEKLTAEEPRIPVQPLPTASSSLIAEAKPSLTRPNTASTLPSRRPSVVIDPEVGEETPRKVDPSPAELNRLAARDRAYMLLSNLTKQGAGWDDSEAWYTLARAHELSHEVGKAKQALWWVVELENNRPIRPWHDVSPGGYTL